jgi:hypothetical protein
VRRLREEERCSNLPKKYRNRKELDPVAGRCLYRVHSRVFPGTQEANMWWYFGIALAVVVAVAYVLSRPARRTTIVLERD